MSEMQTDCDSHDRKVTVSMNGNWVEVGHDGRSFLLTPEQARMLARVIRGTGDEIDRRGR